jgi:hypothetical protein
MKAGVGLMQKLVCCRWQDFSCGNPYFTFEEHSLKNTDVFHKIPQQTKFRCR